MTTAYVNEPGWPPWKPNEIAAVSEGFCPEHLCLMEPYPTPIHHFGATDWQRCVKGGHGYSLSLMLQHNATKEAA